MSGSKSSDISYNKRAALLLEARSAKARVLNEHQALIDRVQCLISELGTEKIATKEARNQVRRLQLSANNILISLRQQLGNLDRIALPESVPGTTETELQSVLNLLTVGSGEAKTTKNATVDIEQNLARLTTPDERAVRIRTTLRAAAETMKANVRILETCMPGIFSQVNKEIDTSLGKLRAALTLAAGARVNEANEMLASLEERSESLVARAQKEGRKAENISKRQEERRYVLNALCETCLSLGFERIGEFRYDGNEKTGDLIQEFDTLDNGTIVFRLDLDSHIGVESEMEKSACPIEFGQINNLLSKNFGVETTPFTTDKPSTPPTAAKMSETAPIELSHTNDR